MDIDSAATRVKRGSKRLLLTVLAASALTSIFAPGRAGTAGGAESVLARHYQTDERCTATSPSRPASGSTASNSAMSRCCSG